MANTPDYRVVVNVGDKRWEQIGAGWTKEDNVSVRLNVLPLPTKGKVNVLLVPNDLKDRIKNN